MLRNSLTKNSRNRRDVSDSETDAKPQNREDRESIGECTAGAPKAEHRQHREVGPLGSYAAKIAPFRTYKTRIEVKCQLKRRWISHCIRGSHFR